MIALGRRPRCTPRRAAAALVVFGASTHALVVPKFLGEPAEGGLVESVSQDRQPYWQKLRNLLDVQYIGNITVGGQTVTGLFDTGSFELLVFGEDCASCGKAVAYRHSISRSYAAGTGSESHSFGSGVTYSNDGYERVEMGPFVAQHAPFWEVVKAKMPVLDQATFQGIIGIGPPGQPAASAKLLLEQAKKQAEEHRRDHGFVPPEMIEQQRKLEEKVKTNSRKLSLLESLGVDRFSHCLGRRSDSPGWLVLDDYDPRSRPDVFMEIPVAGKLTWSVQVTGMYLADPFGKEKTPLGCQPTCGAIVDTGTSLFSLPTHVYQKVFETIKNMDGDCGDLRMFPDLVIELNGQELRFPAESYIGQVSGTTPDAMKDLVHADQDVASGSISPAGVAPMIRLGADSAGSGISLSPERRQKCQLLLMDMGEEITQMGPLAILGMPFFREYYTTFGLGDKRTIHVAKANEECQPGTSMVSFGAAGKRTPRKVEADQLRGPPQLQRREGQVTI